MPNYRLPYSVHDSSSDGQLNFHTQTLKAGFPLLLIASCKNKQHQPCQHWDLSLQTLHSDSHLGITPTQAKTQTHSLQTHFCKQSCMETHSSEKTLCGVLILQAHVHMPRISVLFSLVHTLPPDRDTECYWRADVLAAIVSSPLNPSWRR